LGFLSFGLDRDQTQNPSLFWAKRLSLRQFTEPKAQFLKDLTLIYPILPDFIKNYHI